MTFLIDLTVDNHSNNLIFTLLTKERTTTKTHAFPNITKKGLCFGLTKALLAEGDASFPFAGHCHITLRKDAPVEKSDACAERTPGKKNYQLNNKHELTRSFCTDRHHEYWSFSNGIAA